LAKLLPSGLLTYYNGHKGANLSDEAQAIALCGLFLDESIRRWGGCQRRETNTGFGLSLGVVARDALL
jgi:hypothetical protein